MQKSLLFVFFIIVFSSKSQISITASQMPVSGDTIRYSNARLSSVGDYTTTGSNHTWLFDTLAPISQDIKSFKTISQTPYAIYSFTWGPTALGEKVIDTLPIPNIIPGIKITNIYNFYSKKPSINPTRFVTEGTGVTITFSGTTVPLANNYSDEDELYNFPLNYLDRDSSTFRFSTYSPFTATLIPITYIKQGHRITEADGWGTIATPHGTVNCLRVVTTQYSIDTIKGTITLPIVGTQPFSFGFKNYQRSYQWLTLTEHIPFFEVSGTLNGTNFIPNQARYRDNYTTIIGLKEEVKNIAISVFPNPTSNQITIITNKNYGRIKAEIIDLQGKTLLIKELNNNLEDLNKHSIDVSNIAKGIYILNLSNLEGKQSLKISIQ